MTWSMVVQCVIFGILTGIYSVATTYTTVGFAMKSFEDFFRIGCLFVISAIGGIFAFRRNPDAAWLGGPIVKLIITFAILTSFLFGLSGCFGNAAMVEAMKDNNATFCAKITTPWGGATYLQSNPTFGTATCDGMSINYGNPNGTVSVPVVVTPNIQVMPPVVK